MKDHIKFFSCKRDFLITLLISIVIFILNPIPKAYEIAHIRDDWGMLGGLIMAVFMLFESLLISFRHFWGWAILASFIFTTAAYLSWNIFSSGTLIDRILEIAINAVVYLVVSMPILIIVYLLRKKSEVKHGKQ